MSPDNCNETLSPCVGMVTMGQKELQRVKVIENAVGGRLSVRGASRLLQLSEQQVQRLKRRYQPDSIGWCSTAIVDAPCLGRFRFLRSS